MTPSRSAMVFRGMCKLTAFAFVTNQVLTTIFKYLAQRLDAALPNEAVWLFSCVTCGLLTLWLQSDARRAFGVAHEKGFVKKGGDQQPYVQIADDCPKRWLVIQHMELHPATVQA